MDEEVVDRRAKTRQEIEAEQGKAGPRAGRYYDSGKELFNSREIKRAATDFLRAAGACPKGGVFWSCTMWRAMDAWVRIGNRECAVAAAEEVTCMLPTWATGYYMHAFSMEKLCTSDHDLQRARAYGVKAIELYSSDELFKRDTFRELVRNIEGKLNSPISTRFTGEMLSAFASGGFVDPCAACLDHKVNINFIEPHDITPLHRAARHGYVEVMELLLRRGANIEARKAMDRYREEYRSSTDPALQTLYSLYTVLSIHCTRHTLYHYTVLVGDAPHCTMQHISTT
jgi:hypothetical protein